MRHLRPDDLPHIKAHVGIDMTPREMARWLDVSESEVMHGGFQSGAAISMSPTRLFTLRRDGDATVAEFVRCARRSDEYEPCSTAEWRAHLAALEATA